MPIDLIDGSGIPFPLANDPILSPAKNVEFIGDASLVAVVRKGEEIKAFPYDYLGRYESVNDHIDQLSYAMTYCPQTQSAVVIKRDFQNENFMLRASGYLLHDNLILLDENTESFWSQMQVQSIRGPYRGEFSETFNFVEMTWKTVRENFPEALVFTNTSIPTANSILDPNKREVPKGDLVYGIIERAAGKESVVSIYEYGDFTDGTVLYQEIIAGRKTLIIGNQSEHFITSYINDDNVEFEAVQNQFPIVMKDSEDNFYDVFGVAVSGPKNGAQLESHTAFFALFWAWQEFYSEFSFVD